jgi:hypothetical protein
MSALIDVSVSCLIFLKPKRKVRYPIRRRLSAARFGRSRFGCNDTSCCLHGTDDMTENAHAHLITQRNRQLESLSVIPDLRRAEHFLLQQLEPAVRSARLGAKLKIADDDTRRLVDDARRRLVALRDALDDLESRE